MKKHVYAELVLQNNAIPKNKYSYIFHCIVLAKLQNTTMANKLCCLTVFFVLFSLAIMTSTILLSQICREIHSFKMNFYWHR